MSFLSTRTFLDLTEGNHLFQSGHVQLASKTNRRRSYKLFKILRAIYHLETVDSIDFLHQLRSLFLEDGIEQFEDRRALESFISHV
jgi:hypothetical protein